MGERTCSQCLHCNRQTGVLDAMRSAECSAPLPLWVPAFLFHQYRAIRASQNAETCGCFEPVTGELDLVSDYGVTEVPL